MTVIFGLSFFGGALVGADTKRHNAIDLVSAGNSSKVRAVGKRAVVAKAGYGPWADPVWEEIVKAVGDRNLDARAVADIVEIEGKKVLQLCLEKSEKTGVPCWGLDFIVAGLSDGEPSVHGLQLALDHRIDEFGPAKLLAFGVRDTATNARASALAENLVQKDDGTDILRLNGWQLAHQLISEEQDAAPHSVDFPGEMLLVREGKDILPIPVDCDGLLDPRAIVRIG